MAATPDSVSLAPSRFPLTDEDHAALFATVYKGRLSYVHDWGTWMEWTGARWEAEPEERAIEMGTQLSRDYAAFALSAESSKERTAYEKESVRLRNVRTVNAFLPLARARMRRKADEYDTDRMLLNTPLTTVALSSGFSYAAEHGDLLTKLTAGMFEREAGCPTWLKFLHTVTAGNLGLIDFLQRAVGYSMTGLTNERVAFILHGNEGRNGKSTFLRTLAGVLGDYARTTSSELILGGNDQRESAYALASLRGARMVITSETEKGRQLAPALFKLITGDEPIQARTLYGKPFEFRPHFKLWMATNHRPQADADDQAIWDRMRLIPFTVRIPDEDVDKELDGKLMAEAPGILAWAVHGATIWHKNGLGTCETVESATAEYRSDRDAFAQWLDECCQVSPSLRFRSGSLYESFKSFTRERGLSCGDAGDFVKHMQARGFERHMGGQRKSYLLGVGLRSVENEGEG